MTFVFSFQTIVEDYPRILVCAHYFNFYPSDDNGVWLCSFHSEVNKHLFCLPNNQLSKIIVTPLNKVSDSLEVVSVIVVCNLSNLSSIVSKLVSLVFVSRQCSG